MELKVSMILYIEWIMNYFWEVITRRDAMTAADHFFKVRDELETKYIHEVQAVAFYHAIVQLLLVSGRAR